MVPSGRSMYWPWAMTMTLHSNEDEVSNRIDIEDEDQGTTTSSDWAKNYGGFAQSNEYEEEDDDGGMLEQNEDDDESIANPFDQRRFSDRYNP